MEQRVLEMENVRFCGVVTAAVSHEIKNMLAIINETAGLLDDFTRQAEMAKVPLEPERVHDSVAAINRQVRRADGVVRHLNRFAHSADREAETVDLAEIIELFVALTARRAAACGADIQVEPGAAAVKVETNPFLLLHLLWRGLEFALATIGAGARLRMTVEAGPDGGRGGQLTMRWHAPAAADETGIEFPGACDRELLARLPGKCLLRRQHDGFLLVLP